MPKRMQTEQARRGGKMGREDGADGVVAGARDVVVSLMLLPIRDRWSDSRIRTLIAGAWPSKGQKGALERPTGVKTLIAISVSPDEGSEEDEDEGTGRCGGGVGGSFRGGCCCRLAPAARRFSPSRSFPTAVFSSSLSPGRV